MYVICTNTLTHTPEGIPRKWRIGVISFFNHTPTLTHFTFLSECKIECVIAVPGGTLLLVGLLHTDCSTIKEKIPSRYSNNLPHLFPHVCRDLLLNIIKLKKKEEKKATIFVKPPHSLPRLLYNWINSGAWTFPVRKYISADIEDSPSEETGNITYHWWERQEEAVVSPSLN